jgi:hypothetical protein
MVIVDQLDRLARGIVGQAEDDEIRGIERLGARARILAPRVIERDQRDLVAPGEPFANLKPGGARRTVDEHRRGHGRSFSATVSAST